MSADELSFVNERKDVEHSAFKRIARNALFFCVLFPTALCVVMEYVRKQEEEKRVVVPEDDSSVYLYYVAIVCAMLLFAALLGTYYYRSHLLPLKKDAMEGLKTVELARVARKQFIPENNSFHFYLISDFKLSIEVRQKDYEAYKEMDEINIEYSSRAHVFFGYF